MICFCEITRKAYTRSKIHSNKSHPNIIKRARGMNADLVCLIIRSGGGLGQWAEQP